MDKQSAIRLLNETFNSDFDLNRFIGFTKELFNIFTVDQRDCTKYIASEYKDYISSFVKIGDYENSGKSIEVLAVKLNKKSSRDRARTMQRNFIANWLGKTEKDAALVAFYGDDPEDWRFSFVKMEYNLVKDETGKVKVSKELTPAKRYSFLVGLNEPNHTCRRQFLELVQQEDINPSIDEIEKAFSIDNVTKEFFTEYKELFHGLNESLQEVIKKDVYVRQEFEGKSISTVDFAKKLLGQIVFIYFLQKKGWLGVQKDESGRFNEWGTGPKDFMRKLFGDKKKDVEPLVHYNNFFNDVLELLFYDALATERDEGYYGHFNCKIPFLNGGLFEPINDYDWAQTDILLDNSVFERIFTTFDRFNFTVKEDEPLEKEVAVDPEMLGKVFENLLAVKDRKSKGAFYTPREIVHYMCQQSLINYLETNTSIPRDDIEKFIQFQDTNVGEDIRRLDEFRRLEKDMISSGNTPIEKIQEKANEFKTPLSIIKEREKIDKLFSEIKIVDPAVGSGAFPVGMMNEIVKARSVLTNFYPEKEQKKRTEYALKREVIENSLYGVDIEPSAVEITKLRFWLSLIVDELDMKKIKPLPNLDHKIMCGNSLLEEFEGIKLFDEKLLGDVKKDYSFEIEQIEKELNKLYKEKGDIVRGKSNEQSLEEIDKEIKKLQKKKQQFKEKPQEGHQSSLVETASEKKIKQLKLLQKRFFNEQNRKIKKQLKADIDRIEWELIEETLKEQGNQDAMQKLEQYKKNKAKPFFLWKLYFAEVFQRENPGFDVVIANPPYVSARGANKELQMRYKEEYGFSDDLYNYFFFKSFSTVREKGTITFISSDTYFTINSKINLRQLLQNNKIHEIIKTQNVFDTPEVEPAIIIVSKNDCKNLDYYIKFKNAKNSFFNPDSYKISINTFRNSINKVFFIPTPYNLEISKKYSDSINLLYRNWWDKISTSGKIDKNRVMIATYLAELKEKEITLLGLITDGGVGLQTGNNGKYVGVIEGSNEEMKIRNSRPVKLFYAIKEVKIKRIQCEDLEDCRKLLARLKEDEISKLFDELKEEYGNRIFGQGYIYKIVPKKDMIHFSNIEESERLKGITDSKPHFVKYDKGDKGGNQWYYESPYVIDWSEEAVNYYKTSKKARWQGYNFFFKEGFCWNNLLNPNAKLIKTKIKSESVNDVASMTLIPTTTKINSKYLVCLLNSYFLFSYLRVFVNNTVNVQINDVRQLPIIMPNRKELETFEKLFDQATGIREKSIKGHISPKDEKLRLDNIQKILDKLVYRLYELTPEEIEIGEVN